MSIQITRSSVCRHSLIAVMLAAMLGYAASATADDDPGARMFSFAGFGTLGVVHSSEHDADFTSSSFKPTGAGYSHNWSADVDSLLAAQVTANVTSQLSAVLQIVAEQNVDDTYRPHVEWANIKYQVTPDFSVRAGRIVLPGFLLSDTRKVGFARPWVRPPLEVYGLLPVTHSDGVDVSYAQHVADFLNTVQGNFGKNSVALVNGNSTVVSRRLWGISNTAEYGPLVVRATVQHASLTIASVDPLFDAFRQFGPQGVGLADEYNTDAKAFSFLGVGAIYDPGAWFATAEWGRNDFHSVLGKNTAWYAGGGYRWRTLTPYLTYAHAKADNLSDPGLTLAALPPTYAPLAAGLNDALNSILDTKVVQNTLSIGARWDFMKNTDLKLQFDRTRIGAGSTGVLSDAQPGFQTGRRFNLISAAIDFVF
jgi:hypothetical protein